MCSSILQEALDPVTCYSIRPLPSSNETQRLTKGLRLTIAVGKGCCGRNTDNFRTKVVKDVSHMGEGTLPTSLLPNLDLSLAPAEQQANNYLVKRVFKDKRTNMTALLWLAAFSTKFIEM